MIQLLILVAIGCAVVADEVRNLAIRAAEAAHNTGTLIEGTVQRIQHGGETAEQTGKAFKEVTATIRQVSELVSAIAGASNEQAKGIEELNGVVTEIDKVTQQVAATAEESADGSQEMQHRSETMLDVVQELVRLIEGMVSVKQRVGEAAELEKAIHRPLAFVQLQPYAAISAAEKPHSPRPEHIIPLEDENFSEF